MNPVSVRLSRPVSFCPRCELRLSMKRVRFTYHQTRLNSSNTKSSTDSSFYPPGADKSYFAKLQNRTLLKLDGPDAAIFLHNLIPAPVQPLEEKGSLLFSAFLNAKGRIQHEVFVHKPANSNPDTWYLDVDTNSASAVVSHIKKHKLRSKFKLEKLAPEQGSVVYTWPGSQDVTTDEKVVLKDDPRPQMGRRGYILSESGQDNFSKGEELQWQDYMLHRMLNGHAEGPVEIASGSALPQESNLDFCNGIDFHKGCYLGQELTIRTHHTGVVRKRILPVQIYTDDHPIPKDQKMPIYDPSLKLSQPLNEANISKCGARGRSGRSTGKWLGGYGNVGLALCRLEMMTDLALTAEGSQYDPDKDEFQVTWNAAPGENELDWSTSETIKVKAFIPPWLRKAIDESIKSRVDRGRRKREELDDEDEEVD